MSRRKDPGNRRCVVQANGFTSFYNECSFSKRIWDMIVSIQLENRKKLGCGGTFNGRTKYDHHYGFNKELFYYCQLSLKLELLQHTGTKSMKVTNPDLSNENKRYREKTSTLRAVDQPEIHRPRLGLVVIGRIGSRSEAFAGNHGFWSSVGRKEEVTSKNKNNRVASVFPCFFLTHCY